MRRSEFHRAVEAEFGARGASLETDLVLTGFDGRTSAEALADGEDPRRVWLALCEAMDVPVQRRHGAGRLEQRRG